jgi:hypothetical protein
LSRGEGGPADIAPAGFCQKTEYKDNQYIN